jgi:hypothetical protein
MFNKIRSELKGKALTKAMSEYEFSKKYGYIDNEENYIDLNDKLITYIDLKYNQIWSTDFCKKIKWEIKELCIYFRLVK